MEIKNKKILVLGLGITGISTIKTLYNLGAEIIISDNKSYEDLENILKELSHIPMECHFNSEDFNFSDIDLIIKSPGIPPNSYFAKKGKDYNIEIITDLELAYRCFKRKNMITITGSNGKTTSTVLVGEIFKNAGYNTHVVGNIGTAILDRISRSEEDDVFIIEASSFQLENTVDFRPKVSLITNISEDHIDWHGSYENYINSKLKIFSNQKQEDYIVLNYDDEILRTLEGKIVPHIIWFSSRERLEDGIFLDDNNIVVNCCGYKDLTLSLDNIKVKGIHNIENILGAISIALIYNIDIEIIRKTIENFNGLEHRLEFVKDIGGIKFYNDSKGTNVLSSIKAIEAIESPIILIAGGYNKNSNYEEFVKAFDKKVKKLILIGETRELLRKEAIKYKFNKEDIVTVDSMEEAVKESYKNAIRGDNILLSPASASWDQYKNFEERGNDFKKAVFSLVE